MTHEEKLENPELPRNKNDAESPPPSVLTVVDPEKYAYQLGIALHGEYNAAEAAKLCRVGAKVLRLAKKKGELDYIEVGETRYRFLGVDLIKWKLQKRRTASANTTSPKIVKVNGAEPGTTKPLDREELQALALTTFSRQRKR